MLSFRARGDEHTEELMIARLASVMGALETGGPLSPDEESLAARSLAVPPPTTQEIDDAREAIQAGCDPLGDRIIEARSQRDRRLLGQVFTPDSIVAPMVQWVLERSPSRVVDAGCGSGRFLIAVSRRAEAQLVAFDTDPLSTLVTRAGLAAVGAHGATVICGDYTRAKLPPHDGKTAFVGNPPYVRHHNLSAEAKAWAQLAAERAGVAISGLAGLHSHFFLATALHGHVGDVGCFVTSSEWLDVNYGEVIRRLLLNGLGGRSIHVLEPELLPFDTTATTAAITCFRLGSPPSSIRLRMVDDAAKLAPLAGGRMFSRSRLADANRWLPLIRSSPKMPEGYVELGELCRVHRGAVTGSNATWIVPAEGNQPIPARYLFRTVTKARELFGAGERLEATANLRRVIDLPRDLDELAPHELPAVERFLEVARAAGAPDGYVARNRKPWWSVRLREPAPILATYMARRPPAFVRNVVDARHLNIAHGLYPVTPLSNPALDRLAAALRESVSVSLGRTYAGGLVKFEPREMERIPVPSPDQLLEA